MCLQDSHGMQGRGGLARRTVSFGDKCRRQLTDFGREIRTIPPKWQQPHSPPGSHTEQLLREEWEVCRDCPSGDALTVDLRSPGSLADGSLLMAGKPAQVMTEGGLSHPHEEREAQSQRCHDYTLQWTHKPSTNAASASWMTRHWRQWSWLSTEDKKWPQQRGHGRNGIFKRTRAVRNQKLFF